MTTIYIYGLDPIYKEKMDALATRYGYAVVHWTKKELGFLVGHLIGCESFPNDEIPVTNAPQTTFFLFHDLPHENLRDFVMDLRDEVDYFPYKASTTELNTHWRLVDLITHNIEEHAVIKKITHTTRLVSLAQFVLEKFPQDENLRTAITDALPLTKPREVELDEITACYEKLLHALKPYEKLFLK